MPDKESAAKEPMSLRRKLEDLQLDPLCVASPVLGTIKLRGMSLNDGTFLSALLAEGHSDRDTIVRLIHHQLYEPTPLEQVQKWSDAAIRDVFCGWASNIRALDLRLSGGEDFRTLRVHLAAKVEEWDRHLRDMEEQLARSIPSQLRQPIEIGLGLQPIEIGLGLQEDLLRIGHGVAHLRAAVARIAAPLEHIAAQVKAATIPLPDLGIASQAKAALVTLPDLGEVYRSLPSSIEIGRAIQEIEQGQTVLEATGYGFTVGKWAPWFVRWIAREGLKGPLLHRAFLEHTRDSSFGQEIEDLFQRSRRLRRRWNVVRAGYEAHVRREYIVSIPVLLPQLEGVVTDLMILRNQAMKVGRKVLARGATDGPSGTPVVARWCSPALMRSSHTPATRTMM